MEELKLAKEQRSERLKGWRRRFNSVPGHHIFQWFSKPTQNFTPVISHLWSQESTTTCRNLIYGCSDSLTAAFTQSSK